MDNDLMVLIAALRAKDWWAALKAALKLADDLANGTHISDPKASLKRMQAYPETVEGLTSHLEGEAAAGSPNWQNILALLLKLIPILLPLLGA